MTVLHCSHKGCGYRTKDLGNMRNHWAKKHPTAYKSRLRRGRAKAKAKKALKISPTMQTFDPYEAALLGARAGKLAADWKTAPKEEKIRRIVSISAQAIADAFD